MTDTQIEQFIWEELKRRDVTFHDMIGIPNHGVDPKPEDETTERNQRIRKNRFSQILGSERMKELLAEERYSPYDPYPPIKIPLQDLFRFWWTHCVVQEAVIDEILEDMFMYFTERMRPPAGEPKSMNMEIDFDAFPLFTAQIERKAVQGSLVYPERP